MSTPSAPDVDQPDGGSHGASGGEPAEEVAESGRTPDQTGADAPSE